MLKVPKRELFTLNVPIWIGDLRTEPKNPICVKCEVDSRHFVCLPMTDYAVKIISSLLSIR